MAFDVTLLTVLRVHTKPMCVIKTWRYPYIIHTLRVNSIVHNISTKKVLNTGPQCDFANCTKSTH